MLSSNKTETTAENRAKKIQRKLADPVFLKNIRYTQNAVISREYTNLSNKLIVFLGNYDAKLPIEELEKLFKNLKTNLRTALIIKQQTITQETPEGEIIPTAVLSPEPTTYQTTIEPVTLPNNPICLSEDHHCEESLPQSNPDIPVSPQLNSVQPRDDDFASSDVMDIEPSIEIATPSLETCNIPKPKLSDAPPPMGPTYTKAPEETQPDILQKLFSLIEHATRSQTALNFWSNQVAYKSFGGGKTITVLEDKNTNTTRVTTGISQIINLFAFRYGVNRLIHPTGPDGGYLAFLQELIKTLKPIQRRSHSFFWFLPTRILPTGRSATTQAFYDLIIDLEKKLDNFNEKHLEEFAEKLQKLNPEFSQRRNTPSL